MEAHVAAAPGPDAPRDAAADAHSFLPDDIQLSKFKGGTIRRKKKAEEPAPATPAAEPHSEDAAQTLQTQIARSGFSVGFVEDKNSRHRRTMEDAHSFVYDYGGVGGQGWFAIYDGHAGKNAADWCGEHTHGNFWRIFKQHYADALHLPVPRASARDALALLLGDRPADAAAADRSASMASSGSSSSSVTPTATPRLPPASEDPNVDIGKQGDVSLPSSSASSLFASISDNLPSVGLVTAAAAVAPEPVGIAGPPASSGGPTAPIQRPTVPELLSEAFQYTDHQLLENNIHSGCTAVVGFVRVEERPAAAPAPARDPRPRRLAELAAGAESSDSFVTVEGSAANLADGAAAESVERVRVLYAANVGDARIVLCRGGTAIRLSYDHKGSDNPEAQRIFEQGGFVMNQRVNGVLAVTRSLGDHAMKEHVLGKPYTAEIVLSDQDEFIILACDGVWDVCTDEQAVDEVRPLVSNPQLAAEHLLQYALEHQSMDNLSVMIVRLDTAWRAGCASV